MQNAALVGSWESRRDRHVAMAPASGHLSLSAVGNPASHRASRIRMDGEVIPIPDRYAEQYFVSSGSGSWEKKKGRCVISAVSCSGQLAAPELPLGLPTARPKKACSVSLSSFAGIDFVRESFDLVTSGQVGTRGGDSVAKSLFMFFCRPEGERGPGGNLCCGHAKSPVKRSSFCAGPWKIRPHALGSHVNEGSSAVPPASEACVSCLPCLWPQAHALPTRHCGIETLNWRSR